MFYFVGILSEVRDIFLSGCLQVFFFFFFGLNIRFKNIFEPHKSLIQIEESFYKYHLIQMR